MDDAEYSSTIASAPVVPDLSEAPADVDEARRLLASARENATPESAAAMEVMEGLAVELEGIEDRLGRLDNSKEGPSDEASLRAECRRLEEALNIHTIADRMTEALLFIDEPFLKVAALRGDEHPEEVFGLEAWHSWLTARVKARAIDTLSLEELLGLHKDVAAGQPDCLPGQLREGAAWGSDYSKYAMRPITVTEAGFEALSANPYVRLLVTSPGTRTGFLDYPSLSSLERLDNLADLFFDGDRQTLRAMRTSDELIEALLKKVLENVVYFPDFVSGGSDYAVSDKIYAQAAMLQRDIVSIHPFNDCNGRLSRLIMNWYLEKHGLPPSAPENFDEDLTSTEDEWLQQVVNGNTAIRRANMRGVDEARTPGEYFFPADILEFYRQCYQRFYAQPPAREDEMKLEEYVAYLQAFKEEEWQFEYFTRNDIVSLPASLGHDNSEDYLNDPTIHVGGLIPEDYIAIWGDTTPDRHAEIRRRYCNEAVTLYRGVQITEEPKDLRDILVLFQQPVAATSSYRNVSERVTSPKSLKTMDRAAIARTLRAYNSLLMNDFLRFREKHEEAKELLQDEEQIVARTLRIMTDLQSHEIDEILREIGLNIRAGIYLPRLLDRHVKGHADSELWVSPGVSTSLKERIARQFPNASQCGIVVESIAPEWGGIYIPTAKRDLGLFERGIHEHAKLGFDDEREMNIMGAIDPNAINQVSFMKYGKIIARANRDPETGRIVFSDLLTHTVAEYEFNEQGELELVSTSSPTSQHDRYASLTDQYQQVYKMSEDGLD